MSEVTALIAEIKSNGLLRSGNKLEELYAVATRIEADYAELKAQSDAMAAEVSAIREHAECVYAAGYNHGHLNTVDGIAYAPNVENEFYHNALQVMLEVEPPATDAYLNSVRDSFVDEAIHALAASGAQSFGDCMVALNQLRAGEPS